VQPAAPLTAAQVSPVYVPTTATAAPAPSGTFDSDWPALVARLKLGGMAKMLAQHCELKSWDGEAMALCVPEEHRHLTEKSYQEKLKTSVIEHFGKPIKIDIAVGQITGMTPAQIGNREKQARQEEALASIEQDPFVREMVDTFDAQIIESSIKPLQ
jgi:DNA polymerase-3 subunit gamma/tau